MRATVLKVFDTGKTWDNKKGKVFKIYSVEMSNQKVYETFDDLNTKLNQEVEFNEEQTQWGWKMRLVRDQQGSQQKGGFQRQQSDPKTMYMAYAKDITVALINNTPDMTLSVAHQILIETYDLIMNKVSDANS